MKTIQKLLFIAVIIIASSCATTNKTTDNKVSEERMELDAYAMANIECEYKLAQMNKNINKEDKMALVKFNQIKDQITPFSNEIRARYTPTDQLNDFYILVNKLKPEFTVCKELKELEDSEAKKKEEENKEANK